MFHLLKAFDHPVEALFGLHLLVCLKMRRKFPKTRLELSLLRHRGSPTLHHGTAQLQQLLHPVLQLLQALLILSKLLAELWRVPEAFSIVYQGCRHDVSLLALASRPDSIICSLTQFSSLFSSEGAFELIKVDSQIQV